MKLFIIKKILSFLIILISSYTFTLNPLCQFPLYNISYGSENNEEKSNKRDIYLIKKNIENVIKVDKDDTDIKKVDVSEICKEWDLDLTIDENQKTYLNKFFYNIASDQRETISQIYSNEIKCRFETCHQYLKDKSACQDYQKDYAKKFSSFKNRNSLIKFVQEALDPPPEPKPTKSRKPCNGNTSIKKRDQGAYDSNQQCKPCYEEPKNCQNGHKCVGIFNVKKYNVNRGGNRKWMAPCDKDEQCQSNNCAKIKKGESCASKKQEAKDSKVCSINYQCFQDLDDGEECDPYDSAMSCVENFRCENSRKYIIDPNLYQWFVTFRGPAKIIEDDNNPTGYRVEILEDKLFAGEKCINSNECFSKICKKIEGESVSKCQEDPNKIDIIKSTCSPLHTDCTSNEDCCSQKCNLNQPKPKCINFYKCTNCRGTESRNINEGSNKCCPGLTPTIINKKTKCILQVIPTTKYDIKYHYPNKKLETNNSFEFLGNMFKFIGELFTVTSANAATKETTPNNSDDDVPDNINKFCDVTIGNFILPMSQLEVFLHGITFLTQNCKTTQQNLGPKDSLFIMKLNDTLCQAGTYFGEYWDKKLGKIIDKDIKPYKDFLKDKINECKNKFKDSKTIKEQDYTDFMIDVTQGVLDHRITDLTNYNAKILPKLKLISDNFDNINSYYNLDNPTENNINYFDYRKWYVEKVFDHTMKFPWYLFGVAAAIDVAFIAIGAAMGVFFIEFGPVGFIVGAALGAIIGTILGAAISAIIGAVGKKKKLNERRNFENKSAQYYIPFLYIPPNAAKDEYYGPNPFIKDFYEDMNTNEIIISDNISESDNIENEKAIIVNDIKDKGIFTKLLKNNDLKIKGRRKSIKISGDSQKWHYEYIKKVMKPNSACGYNIPNSYCFDKLYFFTEGDRNYYLIDPIFPKGQFNNENSFSFKDVAQFEAIQSFYCCDNYNFDRFNFQLNELKTNGILYDLPNSTNKDKMDPKKIKFYDKYINDIRNGSSNVATQLPTDFPNQLKKLAKKYAKEKNLFLDSDDKENPNFDAFAEYVYRIHILLPNINMDEKIKFPINAKMYYYQFAYQLINFATSGKDITTSSLYTRINELNTYKSVVPYDKTYQANQRTEIKDTGDAQTEDIKANTKTPSQTLSKYSDTTTGQLNKLDRSTTLRERIKQNTGKATGSGISGNNQAIRKTAKSTKLQDWMNTVGKTEKGKQLIAEREKMYDALSGKYYFDKYCKKGQPCEKNKPIFDNSFYSQESLLPDKVKKTIKDNVKNKKAPVSYQKSSNSVNPNYSSLPSVPRFNNYSSSKYQVSSPKVIKSKVPTLGADQDNILDTIERNKKNKRKKKEQTIFEDISNTYINEGIPRMFEKKQSKFKDYLELPETGF